MLRSPNNGLNGGHEVSSYRVSLKCLATGIEADAQLRTIRSRGFKWFDWCCNTHLDGSEHQTMEESTEF